MCENKLRILNNSSSYTTFKALYMNVPCGKCEECVNSRRTDWFIRAYYEYLRCVRSQGKVLAYTLTFDEEHVSKYDGIRVFDSAVIPKFIKRLRKALSKYMPDLTFTYLCCPEYGEKYARPHYHVLFYVTSSKGVFRNYTFYLHVLSTWCQGFIHVKKGSNYGQIMSLGSLRYTTKYITKYVHGYSHFFLHYKLIRQHYFQYLALSSEKRSLTFIVDDLRDKRDNSLYWDLYCVYRKNVSTMTPKVHCSLGFGSYALSQLTPSLIEKERIIVPSCKGFDEVRLPMYIYRKLFYDKVPNNRDGKLNRYVLSDEGLKHRLRKLDKQIEDTISSSRLLLLSNVSSDMFNFVKDYYMSRRVESPFDSILDLECFMRSSVSSIRKTCIYNIVYRGHILHHDVLGFDLTNPLVYHHCYWQYHLPYDGYTHSGQPFLSFRELPTKSRQEILLAYSNSVAYFEHEESVSFLLDSLRAFNSHCLSLSKKKKEEFVTKFNDFKKRDFYENQQRDYQNYH